MFYEHFMLKAQYIDGRCTLFRTMKHKNILSTFRELPAEGKGGGVHLSRRHNGQWELR